MTPRGSVVMGYGEPYHGTVGQVDGPLDEALAEGTATYHNAAVMVLDGSRDDFRSRGGIAVDEDDDLTFGEQSAAAGPVF